MIRKIDPERRRAHLRQTAARAAGRLRNVVTYRLAQAGVQLTGEEQELVARLLLAVLLRVTDEVLERELAEELA